SPGFQLTNLKGPEVTGALAKASSPIFLTTAAGTMPVFQISVRVKNGSKRRSSVMTTVFVSLASIFFNDWKGALYAESFWKRIRFQLKATSSAVIGDPSENFASMRWKVYVRPSSEISQLSARPGPTLLRSGLARNKREYIRPWQRMSEPNTVLIGSRVSTSEP